MAYVNIPNLTTYDASLGASDWQYDEGLKLIRHNAGTHRTTVLALYSALMDLADNADFMDSDVPIKANTPTEFELINGWAFSADSDYGYLQGGSLKDNVANNLWANFYNLGTLKAGTVLYVEQNGSLVASPPGYTDGALDLLVKVVSAGSAIDSREVSFFARNLGDTYDVFTIAAPATGGRNPIPVSTSTDINDDSGTASDGGIVIDLTGGFSFDIGDGDSAQPYTVDIDGNGLSTLQVYRALKYRTRRQNTSAIGTADATAGRFYRQADPAFTEVKNSPFGAYAGGKFFGAQGVWLRNVSDPNNIQLIDDNGETRTPPVSFTVSVTGVVADDRVLVARAAPGTTATAPLTIASVTSNTIVATAAPVADMPTTGTLQVGATNYTYTGISGATFTGVSPDPTGETGTFYRTAANSVIWKSQFTISSATANTIVATTTPAADIPTSGVIRVGDTRYAYSGISTATFTGVSPDPSAATGVFYVPMIDAAATWTSLSSPSMQYVADFAAVARVRKKGIQAFENTAVVGTTGATISAIRQIDTIVL